jgi:DNA topoisomerase IA
MIVTSVVGHLMELDFPAQYSQWNRWDPEVLFDVPVHRIVHVVWIHIKHI